MESATFFKEIADRVSEVRGKIDDAAKRSGRTGSDVLTVAVTKYSEPNDGEIEGILRAGVFDLGENRAQRFLNKTALWNESQFWQTDASQTFLPQNERNAINEQTLRWHFIGPLQRNKVRRILPFVSLIHSVDSWKLLGTIERILEEEAQNAAARKDVSVLLEVRISDDETKHGFTHSELLDVLPMAAELKRVKIRGLMGMAGLTATQSEARRQFASLRDTLERCRERLPELSEMTELSMGMSGDFEIAVEEGATIVRLGSILYPDK
ncbi:MAG: YggS family pyridoxal phosphate-dependent enzyme [Thermoguttaceae bacterium]